MARKHLHVTDEKKHLLKEMKDAAVLIEQYDKEIREKLTACTLPEITWKRQTVLINEIREARKERQKEQHKYAIAEALYNKPSKDVNTEH